MRVLDEVGRPEPPVAARELATLLGFLDYQRATLDWKTRGLDAAGLQATVGVSAITLGGLRKHLAYVEDYWFSRRLRKRDPELAWVTAEWNADSYWGWRPMSEETYEQLYANWHQAMTHSRKMADTSLAEGGLDVLSRQPPPNGESLSLRWIVVLMIEEYARHNGHADLVRELELAPIGSVDDIDGGTGGPAATADHAWPPRILSRLLSAPRVRHHLLAQALSGR